MTTHLRTPWDGIERRKPGSCRRISDRRAYQERRCDTREEVHHRRGLYEWLRSMIKARLGVDRRKNGDRRRIADRRKIKPRSLLTKEELADLLKE